MCIFNYFFFYIGFYFSLLLQPEISMSLFIYFQTVFLLLCIRIATWLILSNYFTYLLLVFYFRFFVFYSCQWLHSLLFAVLNMFTSLIFLFNILHFDISSDFPQRYTFSYSFRHFYKLNFLFTVCLYISFPSFFLIYFS